MTDRKRQPKSVLEDNKFYQTTSISGFGYISSSNNRIEATIWYTVIVIFICITVINVYTLTNNFLQRPTKTTVSIESFDKSYVLKTMKMDLKLGLPGFNPEYFEHWDTGPDDDLQPPTNVTVVEEVEAAIQELNTTDKLRTTDWPYGIMPLLGIFANHMSRCEQDKLCHVYEPYPDLMAPTMTFIEHATNLGVNQHELMQLFGQQLLSLCGLPWKEHWWFTGIDTRLTGLLNFNEGLVYSFRLMAKDGIRAEQHLENTFQWEVKMRLYGLFSEYMNRVLGSYEIMAATKWYNDLYHPYLRLSSIGGDEKQVLVAIPENSDAVMAGIVMTAGYSLFQKQKKDINPSCVNSNETLFECQYAYVNEFEATRACNCVMTFAHNSLLVNNVTKFCNYEQYRDCGYYNTYGGAYLFDKYGSEKFCKKPQCSMEFLQVYPIETQHLIGFENSSCRIRINILEAEYPLFVEDLEQTFTDYLADLGGAFDLWIGASIIGIIHVVVYLTKQIIYAFKRNTKTGNNVRQAIENWRNKEPLGQMVASLTMALVTTKDQQEQDLAGRVEKLEEGFTKMQEMIQTLIVHKDMK